MVTVSLANGQQTPVASVLITTCSIAKVPLGEVMRVNIFFILAMFVERYIWCAPAAEDFLRSGSPSAIFVRDQALPQKSG